MRQARLSITNTELNHLIPHGQIGKTLDKLIFELDKHDRRFTAYDKESYCVLAALRLRLLKKMAVATRG